MTNKKLTDSEIKKAKELIIKLSKAYSDYYDTTKGMPYDIDTTLRETALCFTNCLNEINRLQEENYTLKNVIKNSFLEKAGLDIDPLSEIKAEAYKEFAERLKENSIATFSFKGVVMVEEIDDLLKELVGE